MHIRDDTRAQHLHIRLLACPEADKLLSGISAGRYARLFVGTHGLAHQSIVQLTHTLYVYSYRRITHRYCYSLLGVGDREVRSMLQIRRPMLVVEEGGCRVNV